jgi:hypothetical protein
MRVSGQLYVLDQAKKWRTDDCPTPNFFPDQTTDQDENMGDCIFF